MDAQSLPIVPFGKYKGQPITTLINDTKYLEWCKQQEWFQKFPIVYNICINQQISQNNPNSKTPEHNKLQNLFLEEENVKTLLKHVNKQSKNVYSEIGICKVEGIYNWDLTVEDSNWWLCSCDWDIEDKNCCDCETFKKFIEKYKIPKSVGQGGCVSYHNYYCEIKPLLGDDYPCVLRKMKQQIELTNNYADKENEETKKNFGKDMNMRIYYERNEGMYTYDLKQTLIKPKYLLIVKDYKSSTTSKEQLIEIFQQHYITIVFMNDILPQSSIENFPSGQQILPDQQLLKECKILTDNELHLQQKLSQSEEKNKQLEEKNKQIEAELKQSKEQNKKLEAELILLKNPTKPKTINDYFGKKK